MDVLSHALWAGAAGVWLRREGRVGKGGLAATIALGALPDLLQMVPVLAWSASEPRAIDALRSYVSAAPGAGPPLPVLVDLLSHHLHCIMHSAVIAAVVGLILWRKRRAWVYPLAGWWLHIALDIPTHSGDYYPVPFLYPLTYWGVDGVAWNTWPVLAANYAALAAAYLALFAWRRGARPPTT